VSLSTGGPRFEELAVFVQFLSGRVVNGGACKAEALSIINTAFLYNVNDHRTS